MNPMTWNEVADLYDSRNSGRKARTMPMRTVFEWAARQSDVEFDETSGTLHRTQPRDRSPGGDMGYDEAAELGLDDGIEVWGN